MGVTGKEEDFIGLACPPMDHGFDFSELEGGVVGFFDDIGEDDHRNVVLKPSPPIRGHGKGKEHKIVESVYKPKAALRRVAEKPSMKTLEGLYKLKCCSANPDLESTTKKLHALYDESAKAKARKRIQIVDWRDLPPLVKPKFKKARTYKPLGIRQH